MKYIFILSLLLTTCAKGSPLNVDADSGVGDQWKAQLTYIDPEQRVSEWTWAPDVWFNGQHSPYNVRRLFRVTDLHTNDPVYNWTSGCDLELSPVMFTGYYNQWNIIPRVCTNVGHISYGWFRLDKLNLTLEIHLVYTATSGVVYTFHGISVPN